MDLLCCDDVTECSPPGSAGVPPAQILAQPRPSPPPGWTGNGAGALLGPGSCCSRRHGSRVPHRRETERHATAVHAGGTPALPGGPPPSHLRLEGEGAELPGPCCSRRHGGRVPHRGETERHATVVHAGGTPVLPGGPPPITLAGRRNRCASSSGTGAR